MADPKMSAEILGRELPEYYTTKSFDKDAQLQKMYGDNASRRDRRKFERYWNSDQRTQDEVAFMQNELKKSQEAWDARMDAFKDRSADYSKAIELERKAAAYDRQQQQPVSWQQAGFTSDHWARMAKAFGKRLAWDVVGGPVAAPFRVMKGLYDGAKGWWNTLPDYQKGGSLRRFQQGGAAPQQDMQQQIVALVQAAMQGDQKATETVSQIIEAAKSGDQQAMQIAQMIQQVMEQMQGQATAAKWGAKLNYIQSLKYAKGGKTCPACEKQVEMKACGGKKAKKRYNGGLI